MFAGLPAWLLEYKFVLLFYALIILLLFLNRKKIEVQAKFIFLYRTKFGLRFMDYCSQKWKEWIILLGYLGVGAGYVGLVFISYALVKNLYDLIFAPAATTGVSLVLPGISVPGLGVLPFWYWLIALFLIALVHEFSHGIVARAHNVAVKNTGLVLFGPILGAFVEPDEQKMRKEQDIVQYSILAAGSFSNIVLALLSLVLLSAVMMPLQQSMVTPQGFTFDTYAEGDFPLQQAGILPGTLITGLNNQSISSFSSFAEELSFYKPGETITVHTSEKKYSITLVANPDNPKKPFLGIKNIHDETEVKVSYQGGFGATGYAIVNWLTGFFRWLYLLSLSIGLFNLLPLPLVDGGRLAQVFLHKLHGQEKGERRYRQLSMLFLLVLLLNLFYPLLMKLF